MFRGMLSYANVRIYQVRILVWGNYQKLTLPLTDLRCVFFSFVFLMHPVDQHELEALFDQYRTLCTKDRGITREVYDQCLGPLGLEKNLVVDRIFKVSSSLLLRMQIGERRRR